MQGTSLDEAVQRPCSSVGEVVPEAISTDIVYAVLLWQWRDGACWEISMQGVAKVHKVSKATTDGKFALLEGLEVALYVLLSMAQIDLDSGSYVCCDQIRHIGVACAFVLFQRCVDSALNKALGAYASQVDSICIVARLRLTGCASASNVAY
jgi:hypothetical protein